MSKPIKAKKHAETSTVRTVVGSVVRHPPVSCETVGTVDDVWGGDFRLVWADNNGNRFTTQIGRA